MVLEKGKSFLGLVKTRLAPWLISAMVLLLGLFITTILWRNEQQRQSENLKINFNLAADQTAKNILNQLNAYKTLMRGVKGYIEGSQTVSIAEFRAYVQALKLEEDKSAILGIGLVKIIPNSEKDKHIAEVRKLGLPTYDIKPAGNRNKYAPIIRMEPLTLENSKALGLDVLTKSAAKEAMDRSRDLDQVIISSHFTLAQDEGKSNGFAFVMYLPIYKPDSVHNSLSTRRSAIEGWVDVPLRLNAIMASLNGTFPQNIELDIYDGKTVSDGSLMYHSGKHNLKPHFSTDSLHTQRQLDFAGRTWTLLVRSTPEFEASATNFRQSGVILRAGTALSFLLAVLAWILARGRLVARNSYQLLFTQASEGVLMLNRDNQIVDANPAAISMFGYSKNDLLSFNFPKLLSHIEIARINPTVQMLMSGIPHADEWQCVRKDSTEFIVEVSARRLDNQHYFATLRDLTNRKKNEQRILRLSNLYKALSETNQAIVRMTDEADLFPLVCKCAVKFGGMQMAWVGKLDERSQKIIPVASVGNGLNYLENINISASADLPEGLGPTGTAFREKHYVVVNNFLQNSMTQPWHLQAKDVGWRSAGAFPVTRNGKPYAVFSIYSSVSDAFDQEAIELLNEMAYDISFALDNFEREAQKQAAQAKLQLAQLAIVESRDRYEDLYEFAPIGYLSMSNQGVITQVNWKVTSMFGLKRQLINEHHFSDFVADEEKEQWQRLFLSMHDLDGGEELNFDTILKHTSGTLFNANLNCLRMEDELGKPSLRVAMLDVTQLKRVEQAKHYTDIQLQATIDAIPDLMFEIDIDGRYYTAYTPSNSLLALPRERLIGHTVNEVLPEPAAKAVMDAINEANINGRSTGKQFELPLEAGIVWFELSVSKKPAIAGENTRFIMLSRDITERKQAEIEFQIAATAFESQEGMMVTDVNKVILRVNKAFTEISGYTPEEAIGQTPRLVSSGHHHDDFYESMWQSIAENDGWEGEVWNRRKSGEVYPQHLTITAVKNHEGVVTNYVATFTDVTLRNAAEAEINHLAFYDVLTRLPNRRLLIDRLNHALSAGARLGWGGALLFLDLDHFKTLNDTLGHDVGDLLLRQVAERLTASVREGDTVARLGGDEFVVMLEDLSKQPVEAAAQAELIANKILTSISQPFQLANNVYQTTASIGVVLFSDNEHSQDILLKHADIAMYQAKKMGRNTLCFFDPNMQEAINLRANLEVDLRHALEASQFELYYQVQVGQLGKAKGAEALIRWNHPQRGLVSPVEFIPLAEETGLILPIGKWVLNSACAQLKAWEGEKATRDLTLSINVSAKQFHQADFAAQVLSSVQSFGINPEKLKLELTESMLLEHIEDTVTKMKALQKVGMHFSLDDFGTGYSSLQYLKLLPLYQLKIDRSFVNDIEVDSSDQAIVRTVIAMAQTLNLEVIAEGVETEIQRALLASCGCNNYQGFLFGKAMPIKEFNLSIKTT